MAKSQYKFYIKCFVGEILFTFVLNNWLIIGYNLYIWFLKLHFLILFEVINFFSPTQQNISGLCLFFFFLDNTYFLDCIPKYSLNKIKTNIKQGQRTECSQTTSEGIRKFVPFCWGLHTSKDSPLTPSVRSLLDKYELVSGESSVILISPRTFKR